MPAPAFAFASAPACAPGTGPVAKAVPGDAARLGDISRSAFVRASAPAFALGLRPVAPCSSMPAPAFAVASAPACALELRPVAPCSTMRAPVMRRALAALSRSAAFMLHSLVDCEAPPGRAAPAALCHVLAPLAPLARGT
eukprot:CAMPEP_0198511138 /NCGR_PEP_ID=MMETSP1462-20131121/14620_1 /TAXON_ID=1333877 /ORGANISM="Brandtodinium nutriculum, Strain RCC3387" /LENGTH=139 /DNA_ID=CAMNT_0044240499 /DNA_START=116 /DNA_END=537 /DNA_ORIENTATION=-